MLTDQNYSNLSIARSFFGGFDISSAFVRQFFIISTQEQQFKGGYYM